MKIAEYKKYFEENTQTFGADVVLCISKTVKDKDGDPVVKPFKRTALGGKGQAPEGWAKLSDAPEPMAALKAGDNSAELAKLQAELALAKKEAKAAKSEATKAKNKAAKLEAEKVQSAELAKSEEE